MAQCICPAPVSLTDIPIFDCPEDLGQIQRLGFARTSMTNFLTAPTAIADWNAKTGAADFEHIVLTPLIENFQIPSGEPITEGGDDNTTLNGNPIVVGTGQVVATGTGRTWPAAIVKALRALACEPSLQFFMVNEFGQIIMNIPTGTEHNGFPAFNFFIGDSDVLGKNTNNKANFQFNVRPEWRDNLAIVTPADFDPLSAAVFN